MSFSTLKIKGSNIGVQVHHQLIHEIKINLGFARYHPQ